MSEEKEVGSFAKIFKFLVLIACLSVLIQKTWAFGKLYLDQPTVTSISFKDDLDLKFPAVTFCEEGLKSSFKDSGIPINPAYSMRPDYKRFPYHNTSMAEFLWKYRLRLDDLLTMCSIGMGVGLGTGISCMGSESYGGHDYQKEPK